MPKRKGWNMKGIYNPKKLTTDRERFHKIRVLNI